MIAFVTWAYNTSVFTVPAVILSKSVVITVWESRLLACTLHIIQPYWTTATTKVGTCRSRNCVTAAKLSTYNISIGHFPFIVTHSSPLAFIEDLHSARALTWAAGQPDLCCIWGQKWSESKCKGQSLKHAFIYNYKSVSGLLNFIHVHWFIKIVILKQCKDISYYI